jgi:hypothetical protein
MVQLLDTTRLGLSSFSRLCTLVADGRLLNDGDNVIGLAHGATADNTALLEKCIT